MGEPDPVVEPTAILQIVERAAFVELLAKTIFVLGLGKMSVQAHVQALGQIAVNRISAVVTENGEHGASAICTMAPAPAS